MLGINLVAYIFHEMAERSKDVQTSEVKRNEKQWQRERLYSSDSKKK